MGKIFEYLRSIVFLGGVLVGIQVPAFVGQYGDQLTARVAESKRSLDAFRDDAERYFGGDMNALIAHYGANVDPVFQAGGKSIGAVVERHRYLASALSSFRKSWYSPYLHVLLNPVEEIRRTIWNSYDYRITLDGAAILFGLLTGLLGTVTLDLLAFLSAATRRRLRQAGSVEASV